jgi:hypothetical protein
MTYPIERPGKVVVTLSERGGQYEWAGVIADCVLIKNEQGEMEC